MEINCAIVQDMESLGEGRFFRMAMEKIRMFLWENSKRSYMFYFFILLISGAR